MKKKQKAADAEAKKRKYEVFVCWRLFCLCYFHFCYYHMTRIDNEVYVQYHSLRRRADGS